MTERVDRVSGPLVPGKFYLVPVVHAQWGATVRDWPVIGAQHEDREFFGFTTWHYHVDARFLPKGSRRIYDTLTYPLHGRHHLNGRIERLPKPVWRRRKCVQASVGFAPGGAKIAAMQAHYAGQQCARNRAGFVCPHRKAPLGSVEPNDGVIVCPLHGLRIDASTGRVLSSEETR